MATTFDVIYLGTIADLDPTESNGVAENAASIVGSTFGSSGDPLYTHVQTLSPGSTGFSGGGTPVSYDTDNNLYDDRFTIDGGGDQTMDGVVVYNATINYVDGTTASVSAVLFQDTAGNLYLAPETSNNADQAAFEVRAIESLTLDAVTVDTTTMTGDRYAGTFVGMVEGTSGNDVMSLGFTDADGDAITTGDDLVDGGDGDDTISSQGGDDIVYGGAGDDTISAGSGDDTVYAGDGSDVIYGGTGIDLLYGGAGDDDLTTGIGDTAYGGGGDDVFFIYASQGTGGAIAWYGGETDEANADPTNGSLGDIMRLDWDESTVTANLTVTYTDDDEGFVSGATSALTFYEMEGVRTGEGDDVINASASATGQNIDAGGGDDTVTGGSGRDTLDGGAGTDSLTGGGGADVFIADGTADTITDFDVSTGVGDGDSSDNDFVDLTAYYNQANLDVWNAANPGQTYATPLGWMRADQADGTLGEAGNLQIRQGGSAVAASALNAENTGVVCFVSGTMIATPQGSVPVETLQVGDLVQTCDNGVKPILWIGRRDLGPTELCAAPNLRPVRLAAGQFGLERDLNVSPQHGILLRDPGFGGIERLYRARHLSEIHGGAVRSLRGCRRVSYIHFMFDQHEVVFSNGLASESFYPGPMAYQSLNAVAQTELVSLFPELSSRATMEVFGAPARTYSRRKSLPDHLKTLAAAYNVLS